MKNKKLLIAGLIAAFTLTVVSASAMGLGNCNENERSYRQANRSNYATNEKAKSYRYNNDANDCVYEGTQECLKTNTNRSDNGRNRSYRQGRNCNNR